MKTVITNHFLCPNATLMLHYVCSPPISLDTMVLDFFYCICAVGISYTEVEKPMYHYVSFATRLNGAGFVEIILLVSPWRMSYSHTKEWTLSLRT